VRKEKIQGLEQRQRPGEGGVKTQMADWGESHKDEKVNRATEPEKKKKKKKKRNGWTKNPRKREPGAGHVRTKVKRNHTNTPGEATIPREEGDSKGLSLPKKRKNLPTKGERRNRPPTLEVAGGVN